MKRQPDSRWEKVKQARRRAEPASLDASQYLRIIGATIRAMRDRRGMTRKMLAVHSGVSERFLAELETGKGNASILLLRSLSQALNVSVSTLLGEANSDSVDLTHTVEFLRRLDPDKLSEARQLLVQSLGEIDPVERKHHVALIGLRGAGKSTVGVLLAKQRGAPFLELDRLIEQASGVSMEQVFDLYGQSGFRRFERRCLEEALEKYPAFVIATGGSIVSEPATYDRLLTTCFTVWLRADPNEHMERVIAQGDKRPMAQNPGAMSDLRRILAEREHLYAKADLTIVTSGKAPETVKEDIVNAVVSTGPATVSLTPLVREFPTEG